MNIDIFKVMRHPEHASGIYLFTITIRWQKAPESYILNRKFY